MSIGEWDERQLCPDGACVGVIGADGTCKVCGRVAPNWGDERRRGLIADGVEDEAEAKGDGDEGDEDYDDEDGEYEDDDDAVADGEHALTAADAGGEDDDRELCSDGACIGVIGPDGKCKICGKPGQRAAKPVEAELAVAVITEPVITEPVITDAVITEPAPAEPDAPAEPEASSSDPESKL